MKTHLIYIVAQILVFFSTNLFAGGLIIVAPEGSAGWVSPGFNPYTLEIRSLRVTTQITDQFAKTTIEEVFFNPTNQNLQGWFLFPVPKGAVIKNFSMDINGKQTEAELLDATKARQIYEDIVRKTLDPALLEYSNQSMFKVRIFPIEANKEKKIVITYTEILEKDNNTIEYIFPLNTKKYSAKPLNDVSIKVDASANQEIRTLYCPTHDAEIIRKSDKTATIGFEAKTVSPEIDFKLYIGFANEKFGVSFLTHRTPAAKDGFFFMDISPGIAKTDEEIVNKDITFVLDVSGSMAGEKLEQAKKAILFCVENLNKKDRFEIIRFSTEANALFGKRVEVNNENLQKARTFISEMRAIGGTNIDHSFELACYEKSTQDRPHMIIFITDGKPTIGETDEEKLMKKITGYNTDNLRVFTFGIGDDLNTHLLDKITEQTKAFRSYISQNEDIEIKISNFYTKVGSPVLTDVKLTIGSELQTTDVYPIRLPDLFKGSSINILGRYKNTGKTTVILEGKVNGKIEKYVYNIDVKDQPEHDFIPYLWAARKIGYLLDQIRLHGEDKELVDEVTVLAKTYGIITPYTSYLILEDEAINVTSNNIPVNRGIFNNRFADEEQFRQDKKQEYANLKTKGGKSSVVSSSEVQDLSNSTKMNKINQGGERTIYKDITGKEQNLSSQVRGIQGRAVYQKGNEWIDMKVQEDKNIKVKRIQFASKEYFNLLETEPETAQFLSLGKNVQFVHKENLYEIFE